MDYMNLISKSLKNAWKYKFLWLFGFFAASFNGGGGNGARSHIDIDPGLLLFIIFAAIVLMVFIFLLNTWAEGALIHGIKRKEYDLSTNFSDCSRAGFQHFLRIFGIKIFVFIAVIATLLVMGIFLVPAFFVHKALGLLLLILAIPVFLVVIFMLVMIEGWALRYIVLYDQSWSRAISQAWQLFRTNVGKTIGVAFSSFLTKFLFVILMLIVLLILALPAIIIGVATFGLALIPLIALGVFITIFVSAYLGTFGSWVWTLGFIQLTDYSPPPSPKKS